MKGGHLDVHCLEPVDEKFACHICENEELDHDVFSCKYLMTKCRNCKMDGHIDSCCKLGSIHINLVGFNPLIKGEYNFTGEDNVYMHPKVDYKRVSNIDQALHFNYDRLINTDLDMLLQRSKN